MKVACQSGNRNIWQHLYLVMWVKKMDRMWGWMRETFFYTSERNAQILSGFMR